MSIACLIRDDVVYTQVHHLLVEDGRECHRFTDEAALLRALLHHPAELVIVDAGSDLSMEDRLLSWLTCRSGENAPVLMLSPRADQVARALQAGADDFLARPFESMELRARARAVLRRHHRIAETPVLHIGSFELDRPRARMRREGAVMDLTAREFAMAWLFFSNPNACLSRETISLCVWGAGAEVTARTMEQHVYKLRKKLRLDGHHGVTLRTCYALGYKLEVTCVSTSEVQHQAARPPGFFGRLSSRFSPL